MSRVPQPRPVYLSGASTNVFGFMHASSDTSMTDVAILICPPFGWDDVCSYRSRREWASHLALGGKPALRFDLPGSGDSAGSPQDPGRLEAWIAATGDAAAWLRAETGAGRVAAIGIGLGGLVATVALSRGAPIDDLVLWATPARGRTLLRELRAFASLEAKGLSPNRARRGSLQLAQRSPTATEGPLEVGGFVLNPETVEDLDALDLTRLTVPDPADRHVLMLLRDGLPVDGRLRDHLHSAGVEVTSAKAQGYGAMMARPQDAVPPTDVFAEVDRWLGELPRASASAPTHGEPAPGAATRPTDAAAAEFEVDGVMVRESPFFVGQGSQELFGIVTEPVGTRRADECVVLFNAGAIHRIGPNRMWVEAARRWAARGVPVARLDLAALGDSAGDSLAPRDLATLYATDTIDQVRAALDGLQARGAAQRFVLGGLCSGAYWSFHGALQDERVVSALLLNPRAFFWDPSLDKMRELRAGLHSSELWRRAAHGDASVARVLALLQWSPKAPLTFARRALERRRTRRLGGDRVDQALDSLRDSGKTLMLAFSGDEPLYDELVRDGHLKRLDRWPNITLELLPGLHHSLRELGAQQAAHRAIDSAIKRELEREPVTDTRRVGNARARIPPRVAWREET